MRDEQRKQKGVSLLLVFFNRDFKSHSFPIGQCIRDESSHDITNAVNKGLHLGQGCFVCSSFHSFSLFIYFWFVMSPLMLFCTIMSTLGKIVQMYI